MCFVNFLCIKPFVLLTCCVITLKMAKKVKSAKRTTSNKPAPVKGKGDYTDADRKMMADISRRIPDLSLSSVGRKVGSKFGLGDLGEAAGKGLASLFGMGDYTVTSNSLMQMGKLNANEVPQFSKDGKRGIRVTEREYIGDVYSGGTLVNGSTTFSVNNFVLNPGDKKTFPWLYHIAKGFEQWEPLGVVFEFVSTSSEFNGVSQALGTVIMATDYDTSDPIYASKIEMENAGYANSTKPSHTAMHGVECDPSERATKLLHCGVPNPGEEKFYDLGRFSIATQGCSAVNQNLGELWISYDLVFYKKQLATDVTIARSLFATTGTVATLAGSYAGNPPHFWTGSNTDELTYSLEPSGSYNMGKISFPPTQGNGVYQLSYFAKMPGGYPLYNDIFPVSQRVNCSFESVYLLSDENPPGTFTYGISVTIRITGRNASFCFGVSAVPITSGQWTLTTANPKQTWT